MIVRHMASDRVAHLKANHHPSRSAVVLLSGGLDSATTAAIVVNEGFAVHALTFNYGQRHRAEIDAAQRIAKTLPLHSHRMIDIDLRAIGGSALTGQIDVPKDRPELAEKLVSGQARGPGEIPVTYVPARNTIFLAYALAVAEGLQSRDIFIGINALEYSGYPDCRPEYVRAFEQMANLATKAAVEGQPVTIHAPLMHLTKSQVIQRGLSLGVDYSMTHSCYDPDPEGRACGRCDSCLLRKRAFEQLGMRDPALNPR